MKIHFLLICFCCLAACNRMEVWTDADAPDLHTEKGTVTIGNSPLTGYMYHLYPNGDTEYFRHYYDGKLDGESRGWYDNRVLKFVYHYKNDMHEGQVREWFPNGKLYREFNYKNGHEDGMQLMYWDNGKLRANYELKNGRKYGLTGIKNCSTQLGDSLKRMLSTPGM